MDCIMITEDGSLMIMMILMMMTFTIEEALKIEID